MYIQYFLNSLLAFVTSMLPRLYLSLVGTLVGCAVFINGVSANAADFKTNYAAKAYLSLNKPATAPMADPNAKAKATQNLQSASLLFIENNGQVADQEGKLHPEILFTAKAAGAQVYVTGSSIHYLFTKVERETKSKEQRDPHQRDSIKGVSTHRFTLELVGANTKPELVKQEANPYYENYYLAHCPNGVVARSYEKFTLKQVYPGVDWVVYSKGQGLKYDFVLAKGSDASKIKLRVKDADASLNAEGDLVMKTTLGEVVEDKPVSFQEGQELATNFMQLGNQTFGFAIPNANNTAPLTIDPSVVWATYYGGSDTDEGRSCATDAAGNVYLNGRTRSTDFPISGAFQGTNAGLRDVFIVKFDSIGIRMWSTYYGGARDDFGNSCATDGANNIYLAGTTESNDFPISGAFQASFGGGRRDAFLIKFNTTGSRLWATYYGGNADEEDNSCASDVNGNVYLAGSTESANFPVSGAFQGNLRFAFDAFLVKFNSTGGRLWATFYGASGDDRSFSCSTDDAGSVYLSGSTRSTNFPVAGAFQGTNAGISDAFLVKFNSTGSRLWATYYGGNNIDEGSSCTTDNEGNVYLAGTTYSQTFPIGGAFQGIYGGGSWDAFLVKFNSSGGRLWATFWGGNRDDEGSGCFTDSTGNVYLAGNTSSNNLLVAGAFQRTFGGVRDAFLVKFNSSGSRLWATYYGGNDFEFGSNCATDATGHVYLAFWTVSTNLPVNGGHQQSSGGSFDTYIVKLTGFCTPPGAPTVTTSGSTTFCTGGSVTLTAPAGFSYLWSNNDTTQSINVSTSGNYTVQIIDGGCVSAPSIAILVTVNPRPNASIAVTDDSITANPAGATYRWLFNGTLVQGQTSRGLRARQSGPYQVIVTVNGCSDTSAAVLITNLATKSNNPTLTLHPNPATSSVQLNLSYGDINQVEVMDQLGRTVINTKEVKNRTLDISTLATGTYMVRVVCSSGVTVRKLVKN